MLQQRRSLLWTHFPLEFTYPETAALHPDSSATARQ